MDCRRHTVNIDLSADISLKSHYTALDTLHALHRCRLLGPNNSSLMWRLSVTAQQGYLSCGEPQGTPCLRNSRRPQKHTWQKLEAPTVVQHSYRTTSASHQYWLMFACKSVNRCRCHRARRASLVQNQFYASVNELLSRDISAFNGMAALWLLVCNRFVHFLGALTDFRE